MIITCAYCKLQYNDDKQYCPRCDSYTSFNRWLYLNVDLAGFQEDDGGFYRGDQTWNEYYTDWKHATHRFSSSNYWPSPKSPATDEWRDDESCDEDFNFDSTADPFLDAAKLKPPRHPRYVWCEVCGFLADDIDEVDHEWNCSTLKYGEEYGAILPFFHESLGTILDDIVGLDLESSINPDQFPRPIFRGWVPLPARYVWCEVCGFLDDQDEDHFWNNDDHYGREYGTILPFYRDSFPTYQDDIDGLN